MGFHFWNEKCNVEGWFINSKKATDKKCDKVIFCDVDSFQSIYIETNKIEYP